MELRGLHDLLLTIRSAEHLQIQGLPASSAENEHQHLRIDLLYHAQPSDLQSTSGIQRSPVLAYHYKYPIKGPLHDNASGNDSIIAQIHLLHLLT